MRHRGGFGSVLVFVAAWSESTVPVQYQHGVKVEVKVKVKVSFRRAPHVSFFNRESYGNWVLYGTSYCLTAVTCSPLGEGCW